MKFQKTFSDRVIGTAVTLFFLFIIVSGNLDFTRPIEMKSYDLRAKLAASDKPGHDIELVAITDDDIRELGRWPWPRDVIAGCIDNLSKAGAKVIALNIFFSKPEKNAGLAAVKGLMDEFDRLFLAQKENNGLIFYKKMTEVERDLDNDRKLEQSIRKAGNVVLPFFIDNLNSRRDKEIPAFIARNSINNVIGKDDAGSGSDIPGYSNILLPFGRFAESAAGVGYNNLFTDSDGYLRVQKYALGYLDDIYLPSYAVTIVRLYKGVSADRVMLSRGGANGWYMEFKGAPASGIKVPVTEYENGTLINWKKVPGISFHQTTFSKVLKKKIRMDIFRGKIVIIGRVARGTGDQWVTPVSRQMPGVEILANTVDNILNRTFYLKPYWTKYIELGVLLFFGLYLVFILPGLKAGMGAVTTLALFMAYGICGTVLFFKKNTWIEISPPLIMLAAGYLFIILKRVLVAEIKKKKAEADILETDVRGYKSLMKNPPKLKGAGAAVISGGRESSYPGDMSTHVNTDKKPTLGRYEVVDELGRGAMGVVYRGEDSKIHRTVAIKTVSLSDFDESLTNEMKKRFLREAESAGLLTHPNIVAIYDAGEDHDLAYIAMEFLKGRDLEMYTEKKNLLPVRETLSIIVQVAEALEYAHEKGIVHRDIKPANIMRIDDTGEVKVTDFGIARIMSSSRTNTGVIMGTPSYMSPEQVSGKKVDGRSDIFSLGVVLFEMLCGEKPFPGDDMTSLVSMIAKERHLSVKKINPRVPGVLEKVIDKALEKAVEKRYQKAGQMAEHLKLILRKIDEAAFRKKHGIIR